MKIAMFASEALPLSKTGGLADVTYALSKELVKSGDEVILITPYYKTIKKKDLKIKRLGLVPVNLSWRCQNAELFETKIDGITYYLVGNSYYFERDNIYGYHDDCERFAFFALACLNILKYVDFKADIVHVHDWQVGMVPTLLKEKYSYDPFYKDMKSVLTIHNPAFKGLVDRYFLNDFWGLSDELFDNGRVRFDNMVSSLKAGIVDANKITTVSPTHRNELLDPYSDQRLNGILELRKDDFVGILNGIDYEEWNPAKDKLIAKTYSQKTWKEGKKECQEDLLKTFGIEKGKGPLFGIVSRLSWQKGVDLIIEAARGFLNSYNDCSLIVLGSGEFDLERKVQALRDEYPSRVGIYIGYNNELSHKIYAGCDFFLMPSLFEPCGISQMISQRYGTLPVVRYTGGLADTVEGYDEPNSKKPDGIGFNNYDVNGLSYGMGKAKELYLNEPIYDKIVSNALKKDNSWKRSSKQYRSLYEEIVAK